MSLSLFGRNGIHRMLNTESTNTGVQDLILTEISVELN
jgi:hypothetical protein